MKSNPNIGFRGPLIGILLACFLSLFLSQQLEIQRLRTFVEKNTTMEYRGGTPYRMYRQELITDNLADDMRDAKEEIKETASHIKDTVANIKDTVGDIKDQASAAFSAGDVPGGTDLRAGFARV